MESTASSKNSEAVRERETFRYESSLITGAIRIPQSGTIPASEIRSCSDPALTAFAELATLRLGASRALVSLFDSQYQYVVAEATPRSRLRPSRDEQTGLFLCSTALPRSLSVCHQVLSTTKRFPGNNSPDVFERSHHLPITFIDDLRVPSDDPARKYLHQSVGDYSYAGIPIQTVRGINIGVFCVLGHDPKAHDEATFADMMRDVSATIIAHLESRRNNDGHRRAGRMVRGIGSFVEGRTTTSGWRGRPGADSFRDIPGLEGSLNVKQQMLQTEDVTVDIEEPSPASGVVDIDSPAGGDTPTSADQNSSKDPLPSSEQVIIGPSAAPTPRETHDDHMKLIFSRAANIIRESIETEGVVFFDASISSFGGRAKTQSEDKSTLRPYDSLSSDDNERLSLDDDDKERLCRPLGFSTSLSSDIDGDKAAVSLGSFPEKLLQKLLRRHPQGTIINFDDDGAPQSTDASCEDEEISGVTAKLQNVEVYDTTPGAQRDNSKSKKAASKRAIRGIIGMFPGARSVAFFPIWDMHKQRWFAGGFAYTNTPTRVFSIGGEMSFLKAFGAVVMTQVLHTGERLVEASKADVLSSLSHEFRSPLHGIILGTELLDDTTLDAFQGDVLHTIETCSRTLLDTIDHLLDWSRINTFTSSSEKRRGSGGEQAGIEAGMISIASNINLDALAEEVLETVYVGHSHQWLASNRVDQSSSQQYPLRRSDTMQAMESNRQMTSEEGKAGNLLEHVTVSLDISPDIPWAFQTQPGAIRRIIMNLVGNSLKFTARGFIKISLRLEELDDPLRQGSCMVHLSVTDSGCGMTEDYIRNHIFNPFSQQENLHQGVGLGLPLVKKIVRALRGTMSLDSELGKGTRVVVSLPLQRSPSGSIPHSMPLSPSVEDFLEEVKDLKGLRVRLAGFPLQAEASAFNTSVQEHDLLTHICRDWLKMHVLESPETEALRADLVLYDERYLSQQNKPTVPTFSPSVVICRSISSARKMATYYRRLLANQGFELEFSSQPIGPRKLAKILSLTFRRWTSLQTGSGETSPLSPSEINKFSAGSGEASSTTSKEQDTTDNTSKATTSSGVSNSNDQPATFDQKTTPKQRGPDFLLVEDNPVNLKILVSFVKKLGLNYETATNGQIAVDKYREHEGQLKCLLLDISMPVMDGFQAAKHVRAMENENGRPPCTLIALTGLASSESQQEAFAVGIDLFLTKPVQLKELRQILKDKGLDKESLG